MVLYLDRATAIVNSGIVNSGACVPPFVVLLQHILSIVQEECVLSPHTVVLGCGVILQKQILRKKVMFQQERTKE
jgi:hypothetical protein